MATPSPGDRAGGLVRARGRFAWTRAVDGGRPPTYSRGSARARRAAGRVYIVIEPRPAESGAGRAAGRLSWSCVVLAPVGRRRCSEPRQHVAAERVGARREREPKGIAPSSSARRSMPAREHVGRARAHRRAPPSVSIRIRRTHGRARSVARCTLMRRGRLLAGLRAVFFTLGTVQRRGRRPVHARARRATRGRARRDRRRGPSSTLLSWAVWHVVRFVRTGRALPHCAAVVSHGGSGSLTLAIGAAGRAAADGRRPAGQRGALRGAGGRAVLDVMTATPWDVRGPSSRC